MNTMKSHRTQKKKRRKRKSHPLFSISISQSKNQRKNHHNNKKKNLQNRYQREESAEEARDKSVRNRYLRCQYKKFNTRNTKRRRRQGKRSLLQRGSRREGREGGDKAGLHQGPQRGTNHQNRCLSLILTLTLQIQSSRKLEESLKKLKGLRWKLMKRNRNSSGNRTTMSYKLKRILRSSSRNKREDMLMKYKLRKLVLPGRRKYQITSSITRRHKDCSKPLKLTLFVWKRSKRSSRKDTLTRMSAPSS